MKADPIAWYGHIARTRQDSSVRVAWMLAEPMLVKPAGRAGSYPEIAASLGISTRTVGRIVQSLEASGLLRIRHGVGRGHPQHYRLMLPKQTDTSVGRNG